MTWATHGATHSMGNGSATPCAGDTWCGQHMVWTTHGTTPPHTLLIAQPSTWSPPHHPSLTCYHSSIASIQHTWTPAQHTHTCMDTHIVTGTTRTALDC